MDDFGAFMAKFRRSLHSFTVFVILTLPLKIENFTYAKGR